MRDRLPSPITRVRLSADTYLSIGADTSSPVVRLPVSTVNTVATHAYSFKPIPYFRAYTPHTYITRTHLYPAENLIFTTKKFVQPSIGIGIAAANSIVYRAPARYRSYPIHHDQYSYHYSSSPFTMNCVTS